MSAFDTTEMNSALPEGSTPKNRMNVEAAAVAREKGWAPPQEYDYAKYTNPDPSKEPVEGQVDFENPEWAANAAKYEWREEYGDIGPANAQLECMLFHNEFINRAGLKFET
jgi:ATP-dependent RNA helicase DDX3X